MALPNLRDDFGAVGNGVADDTVPWQNFIAMVEANHGAGIVPAANLGCFYKTTAPLVIGSAVHILGSGPIGAAVKAFGLPAGRAVFEFDNPTIPGTPPTAAVIEHSEIRGIQALSDNGLPDAVLVRNFSYLHIEDFYAANVMNGVVYTGVQCFSNTTERLTGRLIGGSTVRFKNFQGGGHYKIRGTMSGNIGLKVDADSVVNDLDIAVNLEGCLTHGARIEGSVYGLPFKVRSENFTGEYDIVIAPTEGNEVVGLVSAGGFFTAAGSVKTPWLLMGNTSAFKIFGNSVHNTAETNFVEMRDGVRDGEISCNAFKRPSTQAVNGPRPGVKVFSNRNATSPCIEYNGAIATTPGVDGQEWTPTDDSGAGLTLVVKKAKIVKVGGVAEWWASVVYPATSSTAPAVIGGLPYPIVLAPGVSGRAGGQVDISNVGIPLGLMQCVVSSSSVSIVNPTAMTAITNATLSGKELYLSGKYAI